MTSYGYFCTIDKFRHRWLVAPHGVLVLHTEIHTHDLHRVVCIITLHVTATFNLIRGTNLAEFISCAMYGDGQCVVVHHFSAVVVDPVAICICHVAVPLFTE